MSSYRPHPKGARTNPASPRAWATCDRSGFVQNQDRLAWQYEWAGNTLINKRLLVRQQSLDKPNPQFRTVILPPDPMPLFNARVEPYAIDEAGPIQTQIAVNAAVQATALFLQSVSGFSAGQDIYVYLDRGGFALSKIVSINAIANSMVISVPLPGPASVGQIVTAAGANDLPVN